MTFLTPVFLSAFFVAGDPDQLPPLPEGHRAYSIKFQENALAGFIIPGSYVDVALLEKDQEGKAKASIVVRRLLVVVVNTTEQKTKSFHTATLAVKPKDAQALAAAEKKGKLSLLLVPPSEQGAQEK